MIVGILKAIAAFFGTLAICGIIPAIMVLADGGGYILLIVCIATIISSCLLYGFADIIQTLNEIADNTKKLSGVNVHTDAEESPESIKVDQGAE